MKGLPPLTIEEQVALCEWADIMESDYGGCNETVWTPADRSLLAKVKELSKEL